MRTNSQQFLPTVPDIEDETLKRYLLSLEKALRVMNTNLHSDLSLGLSRFQSFSAMPAVNSIDDGRFATLTSGANHYIVARISTVNYVATLSAAVSAV